MVDTDRRRLATQGQEMMMTNRYYTVTAPSGAVAFTVPAASPGGAVAAAALFWPLSDEDRSALPATIADGDPVPAGWAASAE